MANHITQEERGRIIARAKQLVEQHGEAYDLIITTLVDEFGISRARANTAVCHAVNGSRKPGPPFGSRNAAKPEPLQRIVYHNARLPRWLCEWLDSQPNRGQIIEAALTEKYKLQPPQ